MSIIDLIKPLKKIITTDGIHKHVSIEIYNPDEVENLQLKYWEAIEVLIEATIEILNTDYNEVVRKHMHNPENVVLRNNQDKISVIEKACYPKIWNEIKAIL